MAKINLNVEGAFIGNAPKVNLNVEGAFLGDSSQKKNPSQNDMASSGVAPSTDTKEEAAGWLEGAYNTLTGIAKSIPDAALFVGKGLLRNASKSYQGHSGGVPMSLISEAVNGKEAGAQMQEIEKASQENALKGADQLVPLERQKIAKGTSSISEIIKKGYITAGDAENIGYQIGDGLVQMGIGAIPGVGGMLMYSKNLESRYEDAKSKGFSDEKAYNESAFGALVETVIEKNIGVDKWISKGFGKQLSKEAIKDISGALVSKEAFEAVAKKYAKAFSLNNLKEGFVKGFLPEAAEEFAQTYIDGAEQDLFDYYERKKKQGDPNAKLELYDSKDEEGVFNTVNPKTGEAELTFAPKSKTLFGALDAAFYGGITGQMGGMFVDSRSFNPSIYSTLQNAYDSQGKQGLNDSIAKLKSGLDKASQDGKLDVESYNNALKNVDKIANNVAKFEQKSDVDSYSRWVLYDHTERVIPNTAKSIAKTLAEATTPMELPTEDQINDNVKNNEITVIPFERENQVPEVYKPYLKKDEAGNNTLEASVPNSVVEAYNSNQAAIQTAMNNPMFAIDSLTNNNQQVTIEDLKRIGQQGGIQGDLASQLNFNIVFEANRNNFQRQLRVINYAKSISNNIVNGNKAESADLRRGYANIFAFNTGDTVFYNNKSAKVMEISPDGQKLKLSGVQEQVNANDDNLKLQDAETEQALQPTVEPTAQQEETAQDKKLAKKLAEATKDKTAILATLQDIIDNAPELLSQEIIDNHKAFDTDYYTGVVGDSYVSSDSILRRYNDEKSNAENSAFVKEIDDAIKKRIQQKDSSKELNKPERTELPEEEQITGRTMRDAVGELIPFTFDGETGEIYTTNSGIVTFESPNKVVEFGNIKDVGDMSIDSFGIVPQEMSIGNDYSVTIDGKTFTNKNQNPFKAFTYDADGNVISAKLENDKGQTRVIKGTRAVVIEAKYKVKKLYDESTREQLAAAAEDAAQQAAAIEDTRGQSTETATPTENKPVEQAPTIAERESAKRVREIAERLAAEETEQMTQNRQAIANLASSLFTAGVNVQVMNAEQIRIKYGKDVEQGMFIAKDGTVVLNESILPSEWGKTIIFHEGTHPIINIIRNTEPKLYKQLVDAIREEAKFNPEVNKILQQINASKDYKDEFTRNDELVVESIARIASGKMNLNNVKPTLRQAIVDFINKIAKSMGFKQVLKDSNQVAFKKLANQISSVLNEGRDISEIVGAKNVGKFAVASDINSTSENSTIYGGDIQYSKIDRAKETSSPAVNVYKSEDVVDLPVRSLKDVYNDFGGKVVFINSDPTKVGSIKLISGKEIFLYGGAEYLALKKNVDNNVGFATTLEGKVKTHDKLRNKVFGKEKGVTIVVTQSPEAIMTNSYALRYILDAISQLPSNITSDPQFKKEFFGEDIKALQIAFGEKAYLDFVNKFKDTDFTSSESINKMIDELGYKLSSTSTPASFAARKALTKNLVAGIVSKDSRASTRGQKGSVSVTPKKFIAKALYNQFGVNAEKVMKEIGSKEIVDKFFDEGVWGLAVAGFETSPESNYQSIQDKGVVHPLFNAKFYGENPFKLDAAYKVDELILPTEMTESKSGEMYVDKFGQPTTYTKRTSMQLASSIYVGGDIEAQLSAIDRSERIAPNGKPSNLNEYQYNAVRTPEFKAWFGDWENDPENASKIVDENGEPMVMYHGTSKDKDFDSFKISDRGAWFSSSPAEASSYASSNDSQKMKYDEGTRKYITTNTSSRVIPVFLNIRNLQRQEDLDKNVLDEYRKAGYKSYRNAQKYLFNQVKYKNRNVEGFAFDTKEAGAAYNYAQVIVLFDGKSIEQDNGTYKWFGNEANVKSAIGSKFSPTNPKIQMSSINRDGIDTAFKSNPELSKIGSSQQYSDYLDTIFPDSQVKGIFYHDTDTKFDEFKEDKIGKWDVGTLGRGFYFSNKAGTFNSRAKENMSVLLDIKNPAFVESPIYDLGDFRASGLERGEILIHNKQYLLDILPLADSKEKSTQKQIIDGIERYFNKKIKESELSNIVRDIHIKNGYDGVVSSGTAIFGANKEYVAFKSSQIHILGSEKDVKGFKDFVKENAQMSAINRDLTASQKEQLINDVQFSDLSRDDKRIQTIRRDFSTYPKADIVKALMGEPFNLSKEKAEDLVKRAFADPLAPSLPTGNPSTAIPEGSKVNNPSSTVEQYNSGYKKYKKALLDSSASLWNKAMRAIALEYDSRFFVRRSLGMTMSGESLAKAQLRNLNGIAYSASQELAQLYEDIFGNGLSEYGIENLDAMIFNLRILQIDRNTENQVQDLIEKLTTEFMDTMGRMPTDAESLSLVNQARKTIPTKLHGLTKNGEAATSMTAQQFLDDLRAELGENEFNMLKARADMFKKVGNEQVEKLRKAGIISNDVAASYKDDFYAFRMTLDRLYGKEDPSIVMLNGVPAIKGWSALSKEGTSNYISQDARLMLAQSYIGTARVVAKNALRESIFNENINVDKNGNQESARMLNGERVTFVKPAIYIRDENGNIRSNGKELSVRDAQEGYVNVPFKKDGVINYFQMEKEMFEQLEGNNIKWNDAELSGAISRAYYWTSDLANRILTGFATRRNPFFWIGNVPMDLQQQVFFTDIWTDGNMLESNVYSAGARAFARTIKFSDFFGMNKEYVDKTLQEYIAAGGAMDKMSSMAEQRQRSINVEIVTDTKGNTLKQILNKVKSGTSKGVSYMNEKTEIAMRLAAYDQSKKNLIKKFEEDNNGAKPNETQMLKIQEIAAAKSRAYTDFAQRGTSLPNANIAYLNSSIQAAGAAAEYIYDNPAKASAKIGQLVVGKFVGTMAIMALMGDAYDELDEYRKDLYSFLYSFDTGKKDKDGNPIFVTADVRNNPSLVPVLGVTRRMAESVMRTLQGKEPEKKTVGGTIDEFVTLLNQAIPIPIPNITSIDGLKKSALQLVTKHTIANAAIKGMMGYDAFRNKDIVAEKDKDLSPYMQGQDDPSIPYFYKAIARSMSSFSSKNQVSPATMQSVTETFLTSPRTNPITGLAYMVLSDAANAVIPAKTEAERGGYSFADGSKIIKSITGRFATFTDAKKADFRKNEELYIQSKEESMKFNDTERIIDNQLKDLKDKAPSTFFSEVDKLIKDEGYDENLALVGRIKAKAANIYKKDFRKSMVDEGIMNEVRILHYTQGAEGKAKLMNYMFEGDKQKADEVFNSLIYYGSSPAEVFEAKKMYNQMVK